MLYIQMTNFKSEQLVNLKNTSKKIDREMVPK